MKFFVAIVLFAAVASARIVPADLNLTPGEAAEIEQILAAIHSPSTDPATAIMLEQMLYEILGIAPESPVHIPAIIEEYEPADIGPAIIDFPLPEGADVPTIPAMPIVPATPIAPAAPIPAAPSSSPLVQIIVNVNQEGGPAASPVQVDNIGEISPVVVVEDSQQTEIEPTPVHVVEVAEESEIKPTPVSVVEEAALPEPVIIGHLPEPVNVAPIIVAPAIVGPEILN